jgi:hypothetical protein
VADIGEQFDAALLAPLQILAGIIVEAGDVGRADRRDEGIVIGFLAEGVEVGAREAGIDAARRRVLVVLQVLGELAARDAQIGLLDVVDREPGIFMQLLGDRGAFGVGQVGALLQGEGIVRGGELLDLVEEGLSPDYSSGRVAALILAA